jgi:hypothetical protein
MIIDALTEVLIPEGSGYKLVHSLISHLDTSDIGAKYPLQKIALQNEGCIV